MEMGINGTAVLWIPTVIGSVVGPEEACNPLPLGFAATLVPTTWLSKRTAPSSLTMGLGGYPEMQKMLGK
jgi:hypothetical protein